MNVLVFGFGSIGAVHAKNLRELGHDVYVRDTDPKIEAKAFGLGFNPVHDNTMDACVIATPTSTHTDIIKACVASNLHILVEKPIAHKVDKSLLDSLEEAKKKNLVVMTGNMLRFHPNIKLAIQHIQEPQAATFWVLQKNTRPDYLRDGVMLNWFAHECDLALYLFGPAAVTSATATKKEDKASVSLLHTSGVTSVTYMDYLTDPEVRKFEVTEADGALHQVDLTLHSWDKVYLEEMQAFIDRINGEETLGATAEDGIAVLEIIEEARRVARNV